MNHRNPTQMSRRRFGALVAGAAFGWIGCAGGRRPVDAAPEPANERLAPDGGPGAAATCRVTEADIEGPFFKPAAPHRASLVDERTPGTRLALSGRVLTTACLPIAAARIEVWQADHRGDYDLRGFGFRGTMITDRGGGYRLETIVPGRYLNGSRYRPAHLHFKLDAEGYRPLTTQLYFEGDPYNDGDPFFRPSLLMRPRERDGRREAEFDFVLAAG